MGRFTRDLPWVRRIFPPSGTPATAQPSAISEDVQLTQDLLAGGQTQPIPGWFTTDNFTNPGLNLFVTIVNPQSFGTGTPEVWRVFNVDFQFQIALAATFLFDVYLDLPAGGSTFRVLVKKGISMAAGDALPASIIVPADRILLPSNGNPAGVVPSSVNLIIQQRSGQAASTLAIDSHSYILRNPQGLSHLF